MVQARRSFRNHLIEATRAGKNRRRLDAARRSKAKSLSGRAQFKQFLLYSGIAYVVNLPEPPNGRVLAHIAAGVGLFRLGWYLGRAAGRRS